ncbi:MAG TPA: hypothetical protein PKC91_06295 [Ignavibacteria bacterium]|nr:hypothetical protein [Ignavibacteria bacterium]
MTADKNYYLKSPEELDLDFLTGMKLKEEIENEILIKQNDNITLIPNKPECPESAKQHNSSGLNPITELIKDEDENLKKSKEIKNKKKIPL